MLLSFLRYFHKIWQPHYESLFYIYVQNTSKLVSMVKNYPLWVKTWGFMHFHIVLSLREKLKDSEIGRAKAHVHDFKNVRFGTLRSLPNTFLLAFLLFLYPLATFRSRTG